MSDSNNEINYGPLQPLIGCWEGKKGIDLAPKPSGEESTSYCETLIFEEAGKVSNTGTQILAVLRYHQVVKKLGDDSVFHDETGYLMWAGEEKIIMHSLFAPRAVGILAGGTYTSDAKSQTSTELQVAAKTDDPDWSIVQSSFMRDNTKTIAFEQRINVDATSLRYKETSVLDIYGKIFNHTDENTLSRCRS